MQSDTARTMYSSNLSIPPQTEAVSHLSETVQAAFESIAFKSVYITQNLSFRSSSRSTLQAAPSIPETGDAQDELSTVNIRYSCYKGRLRPPILKAPTTRLLALDHSSQKLREEEGTSGASKPDFATMPRICKHLRQQYKEGLKPSCTHATPWQSAFISKEAHRIRRFEKRVQREKSEAFKEERSAKMPTFLRAAAEEIVLEEGTEEEYGWPIMSYC